jgi:hypothetical protein
MLDNRRIDPSWLPVTALSQMEFLDSSFFNSMDQTNACQRLF